MFTAMKNYLINLLNLCIHYETVEYTFFHCSFSQWGYLCVNVSRCFVDCVGINFQTDNVLTLN